MRSSPRTSEELKVESEIKRGFVWLGAASIASRIIDGLSTLAVLWFVNREQMGLATLAWSVAVFVEAFNGLGIATAIVQAPDLDEKRLASAYWYAVGVAAVLAAGTWLGAPLIARFWDAPELAALIRMSTVKLLCVGAALVPVQVMNRAMRFERIAAINTFASLTSAVSTTFLAVAGYGAWALVLGQVLHGVSFVTAAYVAQPYRPSAGFSVAQVRPLASFGLRVATTSVVYQLYRNADYFFLGRYLGVAAVGLYRVGFELAMTPTVTVLNTVNRAALPGYARLQANPVALARAFVWTSRSLGLMLVPVTAVLVFCARDILRLVNQGQWVDAAEVTAWLAIAALLRAQAQLFGPLFQASGRPVLAMVESLLTLLILSGMLALGLHHFGRSHGVLVAGIAWTISAPVLLVVLVGFARTLIPLSGADLRRGLSAPLGGLAWLLGLGLLAQWLLPSNLSPVAALVARASLLLGGYAAYLRLVLGTRLADLRTTKVSEARQSA